MVCISSPLTESAIPVSVAVAILGSLKPYTMMRLNSLFEVPRRVFQTSDSGSVADPTSRLAAASARRMISRRIVTMFFLRIVGVVL